MLVSSFYMARYAALDSVLSTDAGLEQCHLIHTPGKAVQQDSGSPLMDLLVDVAHQNLLHNLCWDELALSHDCHDVRLLLRQHISRLGSEKVAD